jgi:hypothetical protein
MGVPYFTQRSDGGIWKEWASKQIEVSQIGESAGERVNGAVHSPTRPLAYLCLCISFEGCDRMRLLERAGGRGLVRSDSHIEVWRAGAGVDTVEEDDAGVCKYAPDGVRIEEG